MPEAKLIIEPVPARDRWPELWVTDDERRHAASFGSERRCGEYLMWRDMVRRALGCDVAIGYTAEGSPRLENRTEYIGVSHSADFVAVVISDRRCAVDIERLSRNFSNISSRYVSPSERLLSDDSRLCAALWCAKETLYKYAGHKGLDLLRDICVEKVDFEAGTVVGRICGGSQVVMQMLCRDDNLVVWVG